MGRMTPAPSEASGGATAAAVADRHRQAERQRYMDCGRSYAKQTADAEDFLSRFPEFTSTDGRPCFYAIELLVQLRRNGRTDLTRRTFREAWLRYLSVVVDDAYVEEFLPHLRRRQQVAA